MSKKILLITSVIFLSSCATTNIQELGDKFLDLINPSDAPAEVADLSEQVLVLDGESGGFTEEELEILSNDELIELAKERPPPNNSRSPQGNFFVSSHSKRLLFLLSDGKINKIMAAKIAIPASVSPNRICLLYSSPSQRDGLLSRMKSYA